VNSVESKILRWINSLPQKTLVGKWLEKEEHPEEMFQKSKGARVFGWFFGSIVKRLQQGFVGSTALKLKQAFETRPLQATGLFLIGFGAGSIAMTAMKTEIALIDIAIRTTVILVGLILLTQKKALYELREQSAFLGKVLSAWDSMNLP